MLDIGSGKLSKRTLLYTAYFIGVTVFFLYYLFPSDAVRDYVIYKMRRENPAVRVNINRVSPALPLGIKLHGIGIAHGTTALIDLDSVKIAPRLLSFFSSRKTAKFTGRLNKGSIQGWAETASRSDGGADKIEGTISGIQVAEIPALKRLSTHKISGNLDGNFELAGAGVNRSMSGKFTLTDCQIDFDQPIIGQSSLRFKDINADLVLNQGALIIKNGRARGNQIDADISGTVALDNRGGQQGLNLNGSVTPHHGFLAKIENSIPADLRPLAKAGTGTISFAIGGTVEAPEFRLN